MEKHSNLPKLFIIFLIFPFFIYFISLIFVRSEKPSTTYRITTPTPTPTIAPKPNFLTFGHLSVTDISDPKNIVEPMGTITDSPLRSIQVNGQKYQFSREYYAEFLPTTIPNKQDCFAGTGFYHDFIDVSGFRFSIRQIFDKSYCGQEKPKVTSNITTTVLEENIKIIESLVKQL